MRCPSLNLPYLPFPATTTLHAPRAQPETKTRDIQLYHLAVAYILPLHDQRWDRRPAYQRQQLRPEHARVPSGGLVFGVGAPGRRGRPHQAHLFPTDPHDGGRLVRIL